MTQCTSTINDVGVDNGGDHEGFSVREGTLLALQDVDANQLLYIKNSDPQTVHGLKVASGGAAASLDFLALAFIAGLLDNGGRR